MASHAGNSAIPMRDPASDVEPRSSRAFPVSEMALLSPISLFQDVDKGELGVAMFQRMEALQQRLDGQLAAIKADGWSLGEFAAPRNGIHEIHFLRFLHDEHVPSYVFKPMPGPDAAKTTFVTVLANLLGVDTPLMLALALRPRDAQLLVASGVVGEFLPDRVPAADYDFRSAHPRVLEYVLKTRWFNELVGNLHCWWGQFLVPWTPSKRHAEMVAIDFDDAFNSVGPAELRDALHSHFQKTVIRDEDCRWLDREFCLRRPIEWSPDHYDSPFSFYGALWQAYLLGEIELDVDALRRDLELARHLPASVMDNVLRPYFDESRRYFMNPWVFLPAGKEPRLTHAEFRELFGLRVRRSVEEFFRYLERLERDRHGRRGELYEFYSQLPPRPY